MKKSVQILSLAMLMAGSFAYAQTASKQSANTSTSISVLGKSITPQIYTATNDFYTEGMSENEFVTAATVGVDQEIVTMVKPYLSKIYSYHVQKLTEKQVSELAASQEFLQTYNSLRGYEQSHTTANSSASRIKWLHWLRLLIDLIDDNL